MVDLCALCQAIWSSRTGCGFFLKLVFLTFLHSALQDTFGNEFLKVSPTSYTICKLIYGASKKNASLAANPNLVDLKSLRNAKCQGAMDEPEDGHGGEEQEVEKEAEEPPAKKKNLAALLWRSQSKELPVRSCAQQRGLHQQI